MTTGTTGLCDGLIIRESKIRFCNPSDLLKSNLKSAGVDNAAKSCFALSGISYLCYQY